jgi:hypothetical protein
MSILPSYSCVPCVLDPAVEYTWAEIGEAAFEV